MTVVASTIIDAAARELFDVDNIKWSRSELLGFITEAQKQVAIFAPEAHATVADVALVAGAKQVIPATGWQLVDVYNNVTSGGDARRAVRTVSRKLLNTFNPDWMSDTASDEVQNVVFDEQDKRHYWVYPPNTGAGMLSLAYVAVPDELTSEATALQVSDAYYTAVLEFVLFRACSKNAEFSPGPQEASRHFQLFAAAMATKSATDAANSPNNPAGVS